MKSIVTEQKPNRATREYPVLMKHTGLSVNGKANPIWAGTVVLFTQPTKAEVVHAGPGNGYSVGSPVHDACITDPVWQDFYGSVTLSNE